MPNTHAIRGRASPKFFFPEYCGDPGPSFFPDNSANRQTGAAQFPTGGRPCQSSKPDARYSGSALPSFENWIPFHETPTNQTPMSRSIIKIIPSVAINWAALFGRIIWQPADKIVRAQNRVWMHHDGCRAAGFPMPALWLLNPFSKNHAKFAKKIFIKNSNRYSVGSRA